MPTIGEKFFVQDGDTIKDGDESIRIAGIDTTETGKNGGHSAPLATSATRAAESFMSDEDVRRLPSTERGYYGRVISDFENTRTGETLGQHLARKGLAATGKFDDPHDTKHAQLISNLAPNQTDTFMGNEVISAYHNKPVYEGESYDRSGTLSRGIRRGLDQTQLGIAYMLDDADAIQKNIEELNRNQAEIGSVTNIESLGDAYTWAVETLGTQIPMLAVDAGFAATGAVTGGLGATGIVARRAGMTAAKKSLQQTMKQPLTNATRKEIASVAAKEAASAHFNKMVKAGAKWGGAAGIYGQSVGESMSQLRGDGAEYMPALAASLGISIPQAALEYAALGKVLGDAARATGVAPEVMGELVGSRMGNMMLTMGTEAATETMQTALDLGANMAMNGTDFDWEEMLNAAAAGALMGGTFSGAGHAVGAGKGYIAKKAAIYREQDELMGGSDPEPTPDGSTDPTPEPESDLDSQLTAMLNPDDPKDSMLVANDNAEWLNQFGRSEMPAYGVRSREGVVLTNNPELQQQFEAVRNDPEAVQNLYETKFGDHKKTDINLEESVVNQRLDGAGNVVDEHLSSPEQAPTVQEQMANDALPGQRVEQRTPEEVQQTRVDKIEHERPPMTPEELASLEAVVQQVDYTADESQVDSTKVEPQLATFPHEGRDPQDLTGEELLEALTYGETLESPWSEEELASISRRMAPYDDEAVFRGILGEESYPVEVIGQMPQTIGDLLTEKKDGSRTNSGSTGRISEGEQTVGGSEPQPDTNRKVRSAGPTPREYVEVPRKTKNGQEAEVEGLESTELSTREIIERFDSEGVLLEDIGPDPTDDFAYATGYDEDLSHPVESEFAARERAEAAALRDGQETLRSARKLGDILNRGRGDGFYGFVDRKTGEYSDQPIKDRLEAATEAYPFFEVRLIETGNHNTFGAPVFKLSYNERKFKTKREAVDFINDSLAPLKFSDLMYNVARDGDDFVVIPSKAPMELNVSDAVASKIGAAVAKAKFNAKHARAGQAEVFTTPEGEKASLHLGTLTEFGRAIGEFDMTSTEAFSVAIAQLRLEGWSVDGVFDKQSRLKAGLKYETTGRQATAAQIRDEDRLSRDGGTKLTEDANADLETLGYDDVDFDKVKDDPKDVDLRQAMQDSEVVPTMLREKELEQITEKGKRKGRTPDGRDLGDGPQYEDGRFSSKEHDVAVSAFEQFGIVRGSKLARSFIEALGKEHVPRQTVVSMADKLWPDVRPLITRAKKVIKQIESFPPSTLSGQQKSVLRRAKEFLEFADKVDKHEKTMPAQPDVLAKQIAELAKGAEISQSADVRQNAERIEQTVRGVQKLFGHNFDITFEVSEDLAEGGWGEVRYNALGAGKHKIILREAMLRGELDERMIYVGVHELAHLYTDKLMNDPKYKDRIIKAARSQGPKVREQYSTRGDTEWVRAMEWATDQLALHMTLSAKRKKPLGVIGELLQHLKAFYRQMAAGIKKLNIIRDKSTQELLKSLLNDGYFDKVDTTYWQDRKEADAFWESWDAVPEVPADLDRRGFNIEPISNGHKNVKKFMDKNPTVKGKLNAVNAMVKRANRSDGGRAFSKLFQYSDNILRTIDVELANMFHRKIGTAGEQGYLAAKERSSEFIAQVELIHTQMGDEKFQAAAKELEGAADDAVLSSDAKRIKAWLDKFYTDYAKENMPTLGKLEGNYFHRVYDTHAIAENREEFIEFLVRHMTNNDVKAFPKRTPDGRARKHKQFIESAKKIADKLSDVHGVFEMDFDAPESAMAPKNTTVLSRELNLGPKFEAELAESKFIYADRQESLSYYITQTVQRAEAERLFSDYGVIKGPEINGEVIIEPAIGTLIDKTPKLQDLFQGYFGRSYQDFMLSDFSPTGLELSEFLIETGFGKRIEGELHFYRATGKLADKLEDIKKRSVQQARDAEQIVGAYLGRLGADMNPSLRKAQSWAVVIQSYLTLAFTAPASLPDFAGIVMRGRNHAGMRSALKGMFRAIAEYKDAKEAARVLGLLNERAAINGILARYGADFMSPGATKAMDKLFKWNGQEALTNFSRVMAVSAAETFLIDMAAQNNTEYLSQLNLTPDEVREWQAGNLDGRKQTKINAALRQFTNESILRPNAAMRTIWGSDPRFGLLWHLKSFVYAFGKVMIGGMVQEMKNSSKRGDYANVALQPVVMGLTFMPLAALGLFARGLLQYDLWEEEGENLDPYEEMAFGGYLMELSKRSGFLGPFELAMQFSGRSDVEESMVRLAGPTVDHLHTLVSSETSLAKKINRSVPLWSQLYGAHKRFDLQ